MASAHAYKTLDGMRGVAAIAVVLFHAEDLLGPMPAPVGYLAGDLFFLLSGFVVAHAYERRLLDGMDLWAFIRTRLARFYPLYLAGLLLGVMAGIGAAAVNPATTLPTNEVIEAGALGAVFLPAPLDADYNLFPLNVSAWALFFLLLVNLLYAGLIRWLSNRTLILVTAVSGIALAFAIAGHGDANFGAWLRDFGAALARSVFSFSAGVLLYRYRPRIVRVPALLVLTALAALLMAPVPHGAPRMLFDLGFVFVASPLLIALGAATQPPRVLAPACEYLGRISFAVFALHYPLLWIARGLTRTVAPGAAPWLFALLLTGLLIGGPVLVRMYEEPMRRFLAERRGTIRPAQ